LRVGKELTKVILGQKRWDFCWRLFCWMV
jgi:hypothetical protein